METDLYLGTEGFEYDQEMKDHILCSLGLRIERLTKKILNHFNKNLKIKSWFFMEVMKDLALQLN